MAIPPDGETEHTPDAALLDVLERATTVYEETLASARQGEEARAYLRARGITEQTARVFRLGATPAGPRGLLERLRGEGIAEGTVVAAGLARFRASDREAQDYLDDRLTLPIKDDRGRVRAIAGRSLGPARRSTVKYLNSAETPVFDKRSLLYGLDEVRRADPDRLILLDGYLDVVLSHHAGFRGAVACLGTALGDRQAEQLRRLGKPVLVITDGTEPGERAARRTLQTAKGADLEVRLVTLPGVDPAELIRTQGAAAFGRALDAAPE